MDNQLMLKYLKMKEKSMDRLKKKDEPIFYTSLMAEVTTHCDKQQCRTCFRPPVATVDMDDRLMSTLFEYADNHFFGIYPTGGDPIRVFDQLMEKATQHPDLAVIIGTHGLSVKDYMLREMADAENVMISTSIDGIGEVHNLTRGQNYAEVIEFTRNLRDKNIPFGVQTVANRHNIGQILDNSIATLMDDIGAVTWSINRYYPLGGDEKTMLELMPDSGQFRRLQRYRDEMRSSNPYSFQFASAEGREKQRCERGLVVTTDGHILYCPFEPWSFGKIEAGDANAIITEKFQANLSDWQKLVDYTDGFCPLYRNTRAFIDFGRNHATELLYPSRGILDPYSMVHKKYIANTNQ